MAQTQTMTILRNGIKKQNIFLSVLIWTLFCYDTLPIFSEAFVITPTSTSTSTSTSRSTKTPPFSSLSPLLLSSSLSSPLSSWNIKKPNAFPLFSSSTEPSTETAIKNDEKSSTISIKGVENATTMTTSTKESSQTTPASRIQRPSTSSVALASSVSSSAVITTEQQSNANANGNQYAGPTKEEYRQGMTSIAIITILFSSNSPVIHAAFINASLPPPVLLLNAMTSTIALAGIFIGGPLLDATVPLPCTLTQDPNLSCQNTPDEVSLQAGLELGLWKMLGTTANLYGLSYTTADHGAFLIQLTTLIVPVVQGIMGVPIPKRIWSAVALALTGVLLFTSDSLTGGSSSGSAGDLVNQSSLIGDALCILAAVFYATYDLRLFEWGKRVEPLKLIKKKITVQAGLSLLLLAALGSQETIQYITNMMSNVNISQNYSDIWLIGSVALWSGIAINAVAPFLQVGGQQAVGATRAQVVYASQPLWAALLSLCLLGETLGKEGLIGGALFLSAMLLAATAETPDAKCDESNCEV